MIGHRAGEREPILHRVETVHRLLRFRHATARTERANPREIAFAAIKEIAIDREHDVGPFQTRHEPRVIAKAELGRETLRLSEKGIVNAPPHFRISFLQFRAQTLAGRRMYFLGEEREAGAAVSRDLRPKLLEIFLERRAFARFENGSLLAVFFFLLRLRETFRP